VKYLNSGLNLPPDLIESNGSRVNSWIRSSMPASARIWSQTDRRETIASDLCGM